MSIALIVTIIGAIVYALFATSTLVRGKFLAELGRLAYFAGLLAYLLHG